MNWLEKFLLQPNLQTDEWIAFATILLLLIFCVFVITISVLVERATKTGVAVPPPHHSTERMYGIQYFLRAIGRKK